MLLASPPAIELTSSQLVGLAVVVADRADGPSGISLGEPLAAVTLLGGDLGVARLGASPAFVGEVETFSPSAVEGLAGAATLPVVLATKPDDDLSIGVDLVSRSLLWSVPGSAPGPAGARGDLAFVAHRGDNDVSVVNLVTGSRVARVNFDVGPGVAGVGGYGGAVALAPRNPADADSEDELFFPAIGSLACCGSPSARGLRAASLASAGSRSSPPRATRPRSGRRETARRRRSRPSSTGASCPPRR